MAAYYPGTPIYSADPDVPPIYGYIPYGKYDKTGRWTETTPSQPSIILVRGPDGRMFYAYEHPPGQGPSSKDEQTDRVKGKTFGDTMRNVEGTVNHFTHEVSKGFTGFVRAIMK